MNVFGAFTFGSLIKTFLPGLVWLAALLVFEDDLAGLTAAFPHLAAAALQSQAQNLLVVAIPAAILLGLVSNVVVFMGINDWLVREPFKRSHKQLHELYEWLCNRMVSDRWKLLDCAEPQREAAFHANIDSELLVLNALGVTNLAYVREQYWYHLEFQINLMFACLALLVASVCSSHIYALPLHDAAIRAAFCVAVLGGTCWLLLRAAKKNYRRHMAKMCSLIAAMLCAELNADKATAPPKSLSSAGIAPVLTAAGLIFGTALLTKKGFSLRGG